MNQIDLSDDEFERMNQGGTREIIVHGQKLWVAHLTLGLFGSKAVVLRGYGLDEYSSIEECREKAVRFGGAISTQIAESFAMKSAQLKQEAIKDMARKLGLDLQKANETKTEPAGDN